MDRLVSKIVAGGLSAAVFLIWWPQHVQGESLFHLGLRGLLWTLGFELILLSVGPLEDRVRARLRRRLEQHRSRVRARVVEALPAPARTGGAVALACLGIAAPVALLAGGPTEVLDREEPPKVVRQVVVEKPVVERKVVVRRVVEAAPQSASPLTPTGAAPSVPAAQVTRERASAAERERGAGATRKETGRRAGTPAATAEPPAATRQAGTPQTTTTAPATEQQQPAADTRTAAATEPAAAEPAAPAQP
jgi:hypothetical protein